MSPRSKSQISDLESNTRNIVFESHDTGIEETLPRDFKLRADSPSPDEGGCCTRRRCCFFIALAIFIGAVVAGLSVALTGDPNPYNYFVPVDPPGIQEAIRWDATAGLYLTIENAAEDSWTPFFDRSVNDWNQTDALILQTVRVAYDYDCYPSRGRQKVCNGDYGNTAWKGLNTAVMSASSQTIVYSTAKLNDYHLKNDNDKLYTTCHELGHGFGLPHTDEDHFNRDRGDCMDYTTRTWNNLDPGQYNFDLLVTLYGTPQAPLSSNPLLEEGATAAPTMPPRRPPPPPQRPGWIPNEDREKEKDDEEDDRRQLMQVIHAKVVAAEEMCQHSQCVVSIGEDLVAKISQVLV